MNWYLEVLKKYAVFSGRARRKEYWMFFLFYMIFYFVFSFLGGLLGTVGVAIMIIYYLATLVPFFAVTARRMHDVGKSGWYMFIPIYSFILAVTEGDKGENKYGGDPKSQEPEMDTETLDAHLSQ